MSQVIKTEPMDFSKPRAYKSVNSSEIRTFPEQTKEQSFTDWIYHEMKILKDLFLY